MNVKHFAFCVSVALVLAGAAVPVVDPASVELTQSRSRMVTISYVLTGEKGIVTVDMQTNTLADATGDWVSVGESNLTTLEGAVNRLVEEVGARQTVRWHPRNENLGGIEAANMRAVVTAWAENSPPDYMVVDLVNSNCRRYYVSTNSFPEGGLSNDIYRISKVVMRRIHAAGRTFRMGSTPRERIGYPPSTYESGVTHLVSFTNDYFMSIYHMTQGQCTQVTNLSQVTLWHVSAGEWQLNPLFVITWENFRGDGSANGTYDWPAAGHAVAPSSVLGLLRTRTGVDFDLPTEAQWEYACRAGTSSGWSNGATFPSGAEVSQFACFNVNSEGWSSNTCRPVGRRQPNPWGLYDMHGLLWDMCLDWYEESNGVDGAAPVVEPVGPNTGTKRVRRGGSWSVKLGDTRSSSRTGTGMAVSSYNGQRLVCPVGLKW